MKHNPKHLTYSDGKTLMYDNKCIKCVIEKNEVGGITCQCGNPIDISRVNAYWIDQIEKHNKKIKKEIKQALDSSYNILPHTFEGYANKYIHLQSHLLNILKKHEI